jgi:hypothetical protein
MRPDSCRDEDGGYGYRRVPGRHLRPDIAHPLRLERALVAQVASIGEVPRWDVVLEVKLPADTLEHTGAAVLYNRMLATSKDLYSSDDFNLKISIILLYNS